MVNRDQRMANRLTFMPIRGYDVTFILFYNGARGDGGGGGSGSLRKMDTCSTSFEEQKKGHMAKFYTKKKGNKCR